MRLRVIHVSRYAPDMPALWVDTSEEKPILKAYVNGRYQTLSEEIPAGILTEDMIVNSLDSEAVDLPLSAAQGKALKDLIDSIDVSEDIKEAINALDVSEVSAETGKIISSVSQTDGKINVKTRDIAEGDIPQLPQSKITGLSEHISNTENPHSVTKEQVGLGNVDNTSDANKPVSTAQQAALALKQDKLKAGTGIDITPENTINVTLDTTVFFVAESVPASPTDEQKKKICLIPADSAEEGNYYTEYIWVVDDGHPDGYWKEFGTYKSEVDLSLYLKISDAESTYQKITDNTLTTTSKLIPGAINEINGLLNEGYLFKGVATPSTNPDTPDGNVFYIAVEPGTYSNFGVIVPHGSIGIISNISSNWEITLIEGLVNGDLINRGIFMPDSSLVNLNSGVILDFKVISVDESKEYYIANIRPKNPLIQITDEANEVVAQYYPQTPDVTATGIERLTIKPHTGRTEQFRITLNWDAVTDTTSFSKNLHINKKNKEEEEEEEENTDLINRGIFMPDSYLNDLPLGAVLNFGVISGIKDDKEYYLKYVYARTGLIQIVDQDDNIVSQYYNEGKKSGIEKIKVNPYLPSSGNTEVFGICVNWDAAGDFVDNEKHLHINKKNDYTDSEDIIQKFSDFDNRVEGIEELTLNKDELQETLGVNEKFNGSGVWGLDLTKKDLFEGKILSMWGDELPEEPTYINHIKNIVGTYGVLIQISTSTNAAEETVISQYVIESPSEVKTGIEDIVLTKVGTNGKEFHMTVDWDNISNDISGYIQIFSLPKTKGKGVDVETRLDNVETRLDDIFEPIFYDKESPDLTYIKNGAILDAWNINCPADVVLYLRYIRNNESPLIQFWYVQNDRTKILAQYYKPNTQPQTGIQDVKVVGLSNTTLQGCSFMMRVNWDLIPATNPSPDIIMNTSILRNTPNNNAFGRIHELEKSAAPKYLKNELYLNVFGDVIPKSFKKKWFDVDKDLEILLLGDSIVGLINSSGEIPESEAMFLPPSMNYYHWTWGLWQRIVKNKPVYDRLDAMRDATPSFTKIGDFEFVGTTGEEDKFNLPSTFGEWSVAVKTFQSNAANASVQFSWDLDAYEKLNIIHSLNPDGAPCKITVSGGDGKIEVSIDKSSWVEANNFSVNQNSNPENLNDTQCSQQGHALHQRHRRIWMRKVKGATGVQTITFARTDSDTSKYMYFWGTERWNQSTVIIQNIGRGGRTTALLNQNISDVVDRNPDLVIHSLSLANELDSVLGTPEDSDASLMRDYNDFFFGGNESRPEYIEPRSMLTKSENYTKWAYLVVIPHGRGAYFDRDTLKNESTDLTIFPYYKYRKVGEYIKENGETYDGLSIINLFDQLINEGAYRGMTMEDTFAGTSKNPNSFTSDGIHLNKLGSLMWTKYLSPLFDKI